MNLTIDIEEEKLAGLTISWEDTTSDSGFDPRVRLGEATYATARTLTEQMITAALGQPSNVDREKSAMITWYRGDDLVFIDLFDDGKIAGIGFD